MKCGNLNFLEPSGPLQACNGTDYLVKGRMSSSGRPWPMLCSKCAEGVDVWETELAVLLTSFSFSKAHSITHCNRDESETHKHTLIPRMVKCHQY